jgi:hypothetical protein
LIKLWNEATIISGEANLGVISIVDNEGLEVNKDHVEIQKKKLQQFLGTLTLTFYARRQKWVQRR